MAKKAVKAKNTTLMIDHREKRRLERIAESLQLSLDALIRLIIHDHVATRQSYIESDMPSGNHA